MNPQSFSSIKKLLASQRVRAAYETCRLLCGLTRFKIIIVLNQYKTGLTVSDLANILDASVSRISHQLRILKKHQLVSSKKTNREAIYQLANRRICKKFSLG